MSASMSRFPRYALPESAHLETRLLLSLNSKLTCPVQLVVVGDQSSGKSSLLESLTGLPFPRDVELCTRYATQITSRRDSESRIEVTIFPGPHASDDHKKHLAGFTATASQNEDFAAQFPGILEEVRQMS